MPSTIFSDSIAAGQMFPGSPVGANPDFNLAGLLGIGGPQGMALQALLSPVLQRAFGPNYQPFQMAPQQGLYDHYRRRTELIAYQDAVGASARLDQQIYVSMLRGMAVLSGARWTEESRLAAMRIAGDLSSISPILAQTIPDLFDQAHGIRGSAAVMTQGVFGGARYRLDPITGMMGMTPASVGMLNQTMYQGLYGPGADLSRMRGLGAGAAGSMFDELSRRGLLPGAMDSRENITGVLGALSPGRDFGSGGMERALQTFDARRINERIQSMAGAVAAMRDIFGAEGHPNAPMAQLIEGLNALTQGGLSTLSPGRLESITRNAYNTSRITGIGFDNMVMLMASGAQRADALGLDRLIGAEAGISSASFGRAYANQLGGTPAFGRASQERMIAIDQQLRINAAGSPLGNQLAATRRIGEEMGFAPGSEAEALYRALQGGDQTYTYGTGGPRSVYAGNRWMEIMTGGGIGGAAAAGYRSQTEYNQRFIPTDLVRTMQGQIDFAPVATSAFMAAARNFNATHAEQLQIGQLAAQGLTSNVAPEGIAAYLASALGISPGDTAGMQRITAISSQGMGYIGRGSPGRGFRNADEEAAAFRSDVHRGAAGLRAQSAVETTLQTALSGLGSSGTLRRFADAIMTAGPSTSIMDLAASVLGMIPTEDVRVRMEEAFGGLRSQIDIFRGAQGGGFNNLLNRGMALGRINQLIGGRGGILDSFGDVSSLMPQTSADVTRADHYSLQSALKMLGVNMPGSAIALMAEKLGGVGAGAGIRSALPALQRLRTLAATRGITTTEEFRAYISRGPGQDATEQERGWFNQIGTGQEGRGFAGILDPGVTRDSIMGRLRQFAPPRTAAGPGSVTRITGDLTGRLQIVGDYLSGTMHMTGGANV